MAKLFGVIKKAVSVKRDAFSVLIILFTVFCLLSTDLFAQVNTAWVRRYNGPANDDDEAYAIALDGSGNVYVTGFSIGSGTDMDLVTIKYNAQGEQQWVQRYNSPDSSVDKPYAIAVDDAGNVYVTGSSYAYDTWFDYITIKYNAQGVQQWLQRYSGSGPYGSYDEAYAIAIDGSGNVYVTGGSAGAGSGMDYVTIKYNSNGVQQWIQRYIGPGGYYGTDEAYAIAIDGSGNVYVTGQSDHPSAASDYLTIKYNADGVQQWVQRYNGTGNNTDKAYALAIDGAGNVYVTGLSYGSVGYDYVTIKYNTQGSQQWVQRYNGPGNDDDYAYAIAVDNFGNVYVTGRSPGVGTGSDYATIKYNAQGVQQWVQRYNGPASGWDEAYAIAIDGAGNIYVTGESDGIYDDYTTIKYNAQGVQQWVQRYNGPGNGTDIARAIALDNAGNVYVTGYSVSSNYPYDDYVTIKYVQTSEIEENRGSLFADHLNLEGHPNPFKSQTTICYSLPAQSNVLLSIYDVSGRLVKTLVNESKSPGVHTVTWNGNDEQGRKVSEGIYFYVLKTDDNKIQRKMLMLR